MNGHILSVYVCVVHRCAQVSSTGVFVFSSAHISDSDNCKRDIFIKEVGGGLESDGGRAGLSHTTYQWRIKLFVPDRVNTRVKEKQKASLSEPRRPRENTRVQPAL